MNTFLTQYKTTILPALREQFGYRNVMQVPRLSKIVVNIGYGRVVKQQPLIDAMEQTLVKITGQKPVHNVSKKSISNFKIRSGQAIGMSVTLRGKQMYDFFYRFIHLTLPRVRDFRGVNPKSFDGKGNYTIGIHENIAFPEVTVDSTDKIHGLQIIIHTTAKTDAEGRALLTGFGMPFRQ